MLASHETELSDIHAALEPESQAPEFDESLSFLGSVMWPHI